MVFNPPPEGRRVVAWTVTDTWKVRGLLLFVAFTLLQSELRAWPLIMLAGALLQVAHLTWKGVGYGNDSQAL